MGIIISQIYIARCHVDISNILALDNSGSIAGISLRFTMLSIKRGITIKINNVPNK
jgi:hypothetical protein